MVLAPAWWKVDNIFWK